jgi:flagellar protein FliL
VIDLPDIGDPMPAPAPAASAGPSLITLILAMTVLTGLSLGAGGLFGLQVLSRVGKQVPPPATVEAGEGRKGRFSEKVTLFPLSPIVTTIASPERTWVRLEASLVLDGEGVDGKGLATAISEDTVAYLRTLSLPLIEGSSGFLHLREDLNDRVRIRSGGKVRDLLIHTFIVE